MPFRHGFPWAATQALNQAFQVIRMFPGGPCGREIPISRGSAGTRAEPERLPDALDPGFHCVRTGRRIRGFMGFRLARRTQSVMLMVPT
jgi:hypothetical protein